MLPNPRFLLFHRYVTISHKTPEIARRAFCFLLSVNAAVLLSYYGQLTSLTPCGDIESEIESKLTQKRSILVRRRPVKVNHNLERGRGNDQEGKSKCDLSPTAHLRVHFLNFFSFSFSLSFSLSSSH